VDNSEKDNNGEERGRASWEFGRSTKKAPELKELLLKLAKVLGGNGTGRKESAITRTKGH